jgi:hypothetical protein
MTQQFLICSGRNSTMDVIEAASLAHARNTARVNGKLLVQQTSLGYRYKNHNK